MDYYQEDIEETIITRRVTKVANKPTRQTCQIVFLDKRLWKVGIFFGKCKSESHEQIFPAFRKDENSNFIPILLSQPRAIREPHPIQFVKLYGL